MDSISSGVRMRNDVVERLFSLFTSRDRAEAMAGDLVEEGEGRGAVWFWAHALRVAVALCRNTLTEAPRPMFVLILTGGALLLGPTLAGTVSVGLFPHWLGSPVNWTTLSFCWWGGAFWAGGTLVGVAPGRGVAACVTLAVATAALSLGIGLANWPALSEPVPLTFFVVALLMGVPLVIGGALARRRALAVLSLLILAVAAAPASAQPDEWRDPSPHTARLVTVDDNVQLEVLDWGGTGPALLLLSGLGSNAHHYDDLAPALTSRYRVVGITRRGHRGSSAASDGYGFDRLAEDVVRVIDAVGIARPVVIGHSFAGEEMHVLGARDAAKIRGLIYVDAAFNRGDDSDDAVYGAVARTVPSAPQPAAGDLASFVTLRAYLQQYGAAGPEGYLRRRYRANADGTIAGVWTPEMPVRQAMSTAMQTAYRSYHPEGIRVPAVAIYAVPKSADDFMRHGSSDRTAFPELAARANDDAALRERIEKLYGLTRERVEKHEAWFRALAEQGRVAELSGTHDLISSNPGELLEQIEAFMASVRDRP